MVKLFITDIDGCLTDGGYYSPSIPTLPQKIKAHAGNRWVAAGTIEFPPSFFLRKFNTSDFVGIKMLHDAGIKCAVLTGSEQPSKPQFDRSAPWMPIHSGVDDKYEFVKTEYVANGYDWDDIAFIGDEINDCRLLQAVGLPACPKSAMPEVIEIVQSRGYVMQRCGGELCVREFTDLIRKLHGIKASWSNWSA